MTGKVRKPATVALLSVVTLGFYPIYWWYAANRELREFGRYTGSDLGQHPLLSALAFGLGGCLVVPVVWTAVTTSRRIERAQSNTGLATFKVWLAVSLLLSSALVCVGASLAPGLFVGAVVAALASEVTALAYMQSALNALWAAFPPTSMASDRAPDEPLVSRPAPVT